jgi:hypothetical protein
MNPIRILSFAPKNLEEFEEFIAFNSIERPTEAKVEFAMNFLRF